MLKLSPSGNQKMSTVNNQLLPRYQDPSLNSGLRDYFSWALKLKQSPSFAAMGDVVLQISETARLS